MIRRSGPITVIATRNFGKVVFVTNMGCSPEEILELCRKRDDDKKEYGSLTDYMDGGIRYVHSPDAAKRLLFVQFVGLYVRMLMRRSTDGEMKALGIPMIFKRLRSLTATELRGGRMINEVPEMQGHLRPIRVPAAG